MKKFTLNIASGMALISLMAGISVQAAEVGNLPKFSPPGTAGHIVFSSAADQSLIGEKAPLGKLALENSVMHGKGADFGFAAKSSEAKLFLMGSYYSEALALAKSGDVSQSLKRVTAIRDILIELSAPSGLYNYVVHVQTLMQQKDKNPDMITDYLSVMQPLLADYAVSQTIDKATLLRTGSWLVDMALAASAGDETLIRQHDRIALIMADMKRMDAPKGVQEALSGIQHIADKKDISKHDLKKVLSLVKKIQAVLS